MKQAKRSRVKAKSEKSPMASRRRVLIIVALLVFWMVAIAGRLIYLQAVQYSWLSERARIQQQEAVETSPLRGLVLDRAGNELARSIETKSFFAVPSDIRSVPDMASKLAPIIGVDKTELAARLQSAIDKNKKFAWIARKVDDDQAAKITALKLEGLHAIKEPKRFYPNGSFAAHILGFVGLDEIGLAGIEQYHNQRICGEAGKVYVEADALGRGYESFEVQSRPGQSVVLTIDQMVQYRTEQVLSEAVRNARAKSGTAIVLDPHTGEILALANSPTFDPNDARSANAQARINDALQNIYEPGSTFKIVAYSAAIEEGLIRPEDRIDCQMGTITVAGRVVHDHHPFGSLTAAEALAKSSNVAAIKLGLRVGDERMYEYMTRFGFGTRTGVELPGETPGLLRSLNRWQPSSMGSLAMGQEIGVTPLQMAAAFGALANAGVRIAPHIVREIRAEDGTVVFRANPEAREVVSPATAQSLRNMLEGVTLNGTAKLAQLDGYSAAGKTGTAQKIDARTRAYSKTKYVGSFVGFAPVNDPAVVIIVVIDEPMGAYHGGDVAAPVFRDIAEQILPSLNVEPDIALKDSGEQKKPAQSLLSQESERIASEEKARLDDERRATLPEVTQEGTGTNSNEVVYARASDRGVLMPDMRGRSVRDVARTCAQLGLQLEAIGEGRAVRQSPSAGAELAAGQTVRIEFGRSD